MEISKTTFFTAIGAGNCLLLADMPGDFTEFASKQGQSNWIFEQVVLVMLDGDLSEPIA